MKEEKRYHLYYDLIRIIACLCVVVNHTNGLFKNYSIFAGKQWFLSAIIFGLCKVGVPLFFMLTGALLLGRSESLKKVYVHRLLRMVLLLLFWSIISGIITTNGVKLSLSNILSTLKMLPFKEVVLHYWYLYTVVGIYIMLPFIRSMVCNLSDKMLTVYVVLGFCIYCTCVSLQKLGFASLDSNFLEPLMFGSVWWVVTGYWIDRLKYNFKYYMGAICVFVLTIIIWVLFEWKFSLAGGKISSVFDNIYVWPVALMSISFFYIVKYMPMIQNEGSRWTRIILGEISKCTLGIYLMHSYPIIYFRKLSFFKYVDSSFLRMILITVLVFTTSLIITFIIRRIPVVKKVV